MAVGDEDRPATSAVISDCLYQEIWIAAGVDYQSGAGIRLVNVITIRLQRPDRPGDDLDSYAMLLRFSCLSLLTLANQQCPGKPHPVDGVSLPPGRKNNES